MLAVYSALVTTACLGAGEAGKEAVSGLCTPGYLEVSAEALEVRSAEYLIGFKPVLGSRSLPVLYQCTHSRVAYSTPSTPRHGPRGRMTSVLYRPITDSARALSYESPRLPTEGSIPASARRSV